MLEWLKDKVAAGKQEISNARAGLELQAQFAPFDKLPGAPLRIADRLARYVLTGKGEGVVGELAALQGTTQALDMSATHYGGGPGKLGTSLSTLITLLPEDAELYLRLALVYEAALQAGSGARFYITHVTIPTFHGPLSWLSAFLVELSGSRPKEEAFFPAGLVQAMLAAKNEDPSLLVRGAFHYEDARGKSVVSRWYSRPYSYFQCLRGLSDLVLGSPDIVQQAFRQKDAGSRAWALQALQGLKIPIGPFAESIAALAVSGSKEVREKAEQLVATRFDVVRSHLHVSRIAEVATSAFMPCVFSRESAVWRREHF